MVRGINLKVLFGKSQEKVGIHHKKTALALTLILALLLSLVAGTKLVSQAEANPSPSGPDYTFRIVSPENKTYRTNNITLSVTSEHAPFWHYDVDGVSFQSMIWIEDTVSLNLSDGSHTIVATAFSMGSTCVTFIIDTTPPNVSVASPENKTYNMFDVPLNFTVNDQVSQITYSLDGQENVTIAGNTTLTDLPDGEHNVTVYAQDMAGNVGASEAVTFTIDTPEPFPTTPVAAVSIALAVAVGVGLLVYFKKRRN
jgi:hypothetical protein